MAQRTVTTRLSAAQAARETLEAEIAELPAEIASRSPPADSEVPPSDISPPSLPHQVHDRSGAPDMDTPAPGIAQLLHQQQQMMATLVDFVRSTERQPSVTPSLTPRVTSARPWKMDVPVLSSPEDSDLTSFTDWRTRWADYLSLTRAMDGIETLTARQGLLRSALHPDWTVLWQTGRLDVQADDDIDAIVPKLERYLRSRRTRSSTGRSSSAGPKVSTKISTSSWPPWSGFTTGVRLTTTRRAAVITAATHSTTVAISVISASGTKWFRYSLTRACSGVCGWEEYDQQLTPHRHPADLPSVRGVPCH